MQGNQTRDHRSWSKAMSKRQAHASRREGFASLTAQINTGNSQIRRTRRGISIFEDKQMRDCTQERTAVPMLKDDQLHSKLRRVIKNTELAGTYESV